MRVDVDFVVKRLVQVQNKGSRGRPFYKVEMQKNCFLQLQDYKDQEKVVQRLRYL